MSDVYAKLVTHNAGYDLQKEDVKEKLILNEYYPIETILIGSWMSYVSIPEKGSFNSVFFEFYDEDKNLLEEGMFSEELKHLTIHDY